MPADLWEENNNTMVIRRAIEPTDWPRFRIYARRIHGFAVGKRRKSMRPSAKCLLALARAKPHDIPHLFPNVRSWHWPSLLSDASDEAFQCMPLMMSIATEAVDFNLNGLGVIGLPSVQSMLSTFPAIQNVRIWGEPENPLVLQALPDFFSHGQALRSAAIVNIPLSGSVAQHLAGFEHLARLSVFLDHRWSSSQISGFQALVDLSIESGTFHPMLLFLRIIESPKLQSVSLCTMDLIEPAAHEIASIFTTLVPQFPHMQLRSLRVHTQFMHPSGLSNFVERDDMRPLFAFRNLSCLELWISTSFHMGNQDVREMAAAWPHLESLILSRNGWLGASSVTIAGLAHLLCLPDLHTLSIPIDGSIVDLTLEMTSALQRNTRIQSLNLLDSVINDSEADAVATLLATLTPNVEYIDAWDCTTVCRTEATSWQLAAEYRDRWNKVARMVSEKNKGISEEVVAAFID
ncbi:hypothetical protein HWV62_28791 [Athelia sp. TMB]|nr:hypothetical protein HWV62_28791 [Athelia sp. TMB]